MSYRPHLPEEAREEVEKLKDHYRERERRKRRKAEERGEDFKLEKMPWRNESMQFDQGYLILQALKQNKITEK